MKRKMSLKLANEIIDLVDKWQHTYYLTGISDYNDSAHVEYHTLEKVDLLVDKVQKLIDDHIKSITSITPEIVLQHDDDEGYERWI